MTTPQRIQRSRRKGWRAPEGAVYVGRSRSNFGLGRWGNRYQIGHALEHVDGTRVKVRDAAHAVQLYREWLDWQFGQFQTFEPALVQELRGRDLVCWCAPGSPCHADVLLDIANR